MANFQASEEEQFVPREIVRAFSMRIRANNENDADGGSEIERALVQNFEDDESQQKKRIRQINEYLDSTSQLGRALQLSMQEFTSRVQKSTSQDVAPRKIETWEDVASIVENMMDRLKRKQDASKFRRATKHLRTFCNTVKAHSTGLKMLPTSNDYVTVFYGALATVLQASEGYTKIMEALPRALAEINDAVAAIEKRSWLFENDTMKCYMWRIYSQIFSFLGEVIRWYTKRSVQRLLSSFNEHLPEFFDDQVEEIQKLAKLVHDEADFRAQADAQINRLYLEEMDGKFDRFMIELSERDRAQRGRYERFREALEERKRDELWDKQVLEKILLETWNKIKRQDTGFAMTEILEEDARRRISWLEGPEDMELMHSDSFLDSRTSMRRDSGDSDTAKGTRDALLLRSARLEDYFDRAKVMMPRPSENEAAFADPDVADQIRSWIMATDSQLLYTSGMDPFGESSQTSDAASHYALVVREAGLPVCSYSCSLQSEDPPAGRTRETVELVALVYSLIRQLVELLPSTPGPKGVTMEDLRWTKLDGTLSTFSVALDILSALLLATKHAVVIIIIDGIDLLDDPSHRSTEKWLTDLVQLFVELPAMSQSAVFKVWFNSGGISPTLFEVLQPSQIAISGLPEFCSGRQMTGSELLML
ncbi:phytanoyl-dioxygenase family protein [Stemphylium lycopersici]|uniref:Phytanoyl-dioxygenase family protein n=1 Tax=Stemphylium lycopersici TaxID=183478 RepID=A0A364MXE5_STELY|nr:phytanoyl-dioxygenase family protein [Stemphylium lycopersici]RAR11938.1 phytanoyl-dioxygenase family protein [Stemphylium lycopersici]